MSGFGDEQLNNIAYSLEEIGNYMGRIAKSMEALVKMQELNAYPLKDTSKEKRS